MTTCVRRASSRSPLAALTGAAPAAAQSLTGAGATFPNPIYTKWFDAYNKKTGIQINYQSIGSGGGIRQFTEGTVDFGATDGPMNESQIAGGQRQRAPRPDRAGRGGRDLQPARRSATPSSSSTATRWSTSSWAGSPSGTTSGSPRSIPGVKLPDLDLIVVHRSDGSGTTLRLHRLPEQVLARVEGQGRLRHLGQLAGRARRQGQRGRHPAGQADRGRPRLRRADLRHLEQAAVRARSRTPSGSFVEPSLESVTAAAASAKLAEGHRFPGVDHQRARRRGVPDRVVHLAAGAEGHEGRRPRPSSSKDFLTWMITPEAQKMAARAALRPAAARSRHAHRRRGCRR